MIRSTHMPRRGFGLRSLVAAVAVVCSMAAGQQARASDITFNLTQLTFYQGSSSLSSGGYTLLFAATNGILTGTSDPSLGGLNALAISSFSISKTAGASDLIFKSYVMGAVFNQTGNAISFDLTGGTGTSTGNTFTQGGSSNYNGSYSLVGSQSVTYSLVNFGVAGNGAPDQVTFNSLTFSTVPEPSTYALGAIATGVMAAIARRRKARKA